MKRVLIIYTGGTIGMTRTENGYAPRAGYFRAALDAIPDLRAPEMPEWEFYELAAAGFIQHDRARMELHRRADRAEI